MPLEIPFTFPLKNGLHARPASFFRDTAACFDSKITLTNHQNKITVNAKSTLALISTLTKFGDECTLTFEGGDEQSAIAAFRDFLSVQFPQCDPELPASGRDQGHVAFIPRILKPDQDRILLGIPVCKGIARANALVLDVDLNLPDLSAYKQGTFSQELSKVQFAFDAVKRNMEKRLALSMNKTEKAILKAQLSIVSDEEFSRSAILQLERKVCRAGDAIVAAAKQFEDLLGRSESVYLRERVIDIKDITKQLISALYGDRKDLSEIVLTVETVCVAEFLTPMQFSMLDKKLLKGIVLSQGGENSHTAIFARSFNIPCVVGVANAPRRITLGQELLLDATRGIVIPEPSARVLRFYEYELKKETVRQQKLQEHVNLPGRTADGKKLEIAANVGSLEEVTLAFQNGAEGIGLFRTEMLFINRNQPPTEEEQFSIYSETARIAGSRPVIVRTLDIGGDKRISYLPLPEEENPYLGCRAVRMYNKYHSVIDAHLRALIRASAFGNLKVMFPMISNINEVRMMREWMRKITNEYAKTGVAFNERLQIGVMIEVPSAAFIIDQLSREVDFFSIGSNDLAQYFVAADRGNKNVTYLCNPFQPSFLRLIKHVIDEAHRWGKWIGLCGEMGGNLLATPLFVGCKIDEISLVYSNIPSIKHLISKCNSIDCRDLLQSTLQRENASEIEAELRTFAKQWADHSLVSIENVQLYSESTTKEEAIKELVDLLELSARLSDADKVEEALWQREEAYSTGVGFGIAIPHCKSSDVIINSIAMLRLRNPIEWKSLDASPVRLVLMLAVNTNDLNNEHLKMIAKLSRKLMDEEYRNKLIRAESAVEVITLLNYVLTI